MRRSHPLVTARRACAFALAVSLTVVAGGCDDDPVDASDDVAVDTVSPTDVRVDSAEPDTDAGADSGTSDVGLADADGADGVDSDADTCVPAPCSVLGSDPRCCDIDGDPCLGPHDGTVECDPAVGQPASVSCVDPDGDGTSHCFAYCNAGVSCSRGSICDERLEACIQGDCTSGFFGDDCPPGEKCVPVGNGASFCTMLKEVGEACQAHTDCGPGLACIDGTCALPDCAPLTGDPACPSGQICLGESIDGDPIDLGFCITACDPLARDVDGQPVDTCGEPGDDAVCLISDRRNAQDELFGHCEASVPSGSAAAGEPCDGQSPATACGSPDDGLDTLLCVGSTCEVICDPTDPATCPGMDQGCFQVTFSSDNGGTFTPDWGLCDATCEPTWDPDGPGGCPMGEYCWPDFDVPGRGRCFEDTGAGSRDACDVETRAGCDDLHVCLTTQTDDQGNAIAAECSLLCDPSADIGAAGSCAAGPDGQQRTCLALVADDAMGNPIPLPVGTCNDTCDVTDLANRGCTPAEDGSPRTCQVGALFGIPEVDLCTSGPATPLPLNGDCGAAGLEELEFCKDNGVCLDTDGNGTVTCVEVCAPVGAAMPPQCSQQGASCDGLLQIQDAGICQL